MNTDKTLTQEFINNNKYPIWFYKKLKEVNIDYVIAYMLTTKFVVDIEGEKYEITFGKNKKHIIGQNIRYSNHNSGRCSFEVINEGFRKGKWYIITDEDISKEEYNKLIKLEEEMKLNDFKNFLKKSYESLAEDDFNLNYKLKNNYKDFEEFRKTMLNCIENITYEDLKHIRN